MGRYASIPTALPSQIEQLILPFKTKVSSKQRIIKFHIFVTYLKFIDNQLKSNLIINAFATVHIIVTMIYQ